MLVAINDELSIGVEFQIPPPVYDGVRRKNWEAGRQASKWLASVLSPDGHGNVNRGGVSKSSTAPRDWDACARWVGEGKAR